MPQVHVSGLFPIPFMRVQGLLGAACVSRLIEGAGHLRQASNARSDRLLHSEVLSPASLPVLSEVSALVVPRLVDFGSLLFGENLDWSIKEMWLNTLEHGGHQALHSHANSFISGVVYLTACHTSARTVFHRGLGGNEFTFKNDHAGARVGPFNGSKWVVPEVAPGDLVLFPSYLLHEVPQNQGSTRLSLSFNALPDRLKSWDYVVRFSPG
jgi:hypothetical protein